VSASPEFLLVGTVCGRIDMLMTGSGKLGRPGDRMVRVSQACHGVGLHRCYDGEDVTGSAERGLRVSAYWNTCG